MNSNDRSRELHRLYAAPQPFLSGPLFRGSAEAFSLAPHLLVRNLLYFVSVCTFIFSPLFSDITMISLDKCALGSGQALVFPGKGLGCDLPLAYGYIPS